MELWPIQVKFVQMVLDAVARGVKRYLITSPTGTGKSLSMATVIFQLVELGYHVILFTNRKWLVDQLMETLDKHGIDYGVRASGYDNDEGQFWPVQIASLPTERKRVLDLKRWTIFGHGRAKVIGIIDEAHTSNGPQDREIFKLHTEAGHQLVGVTATPLDLEGTYDELGIAGRVSDGQQCGALVGARHYGPDEPDFRALTSAPQDGQDFSSGQLRKLMGTPSLFGRIWENYERVNPQHTPTLLFADGVESSLWFAEQFSLKGVPAAHIDGEDIWMAGDFVKTGKDSRKELIAESRAGGIRVICNRFVAREGVDMPWIRCIIAATVFGHLGTYLQSLGRGLRADVYPDTVKRWGPKQWLDIIDHGGNWWRHGSVTEDRDWALSLTGEMAAGRRAKRMRADPLSQPFTCPECRRAWPGRGKTCSVALGGCGYVLPERQKRSRPVVTAAGTVKLLSGDIFRKRRTYGSGRQEHNGPKLWERMYWRARSKRTTTKLVDGIPTEVEVGWSATFRQAFAVFFRENNYGWPDPSWPFMPVKEDDEYRQVVDVPMSDLVQKPGAFQGTTLYEESDNGRGDDSSPAGGTEPEGAEEEGGAEEGGGEADSG